MLALEVELEGVEELEEDGVAVLVDDVLVLEVELEGVEELEEDA